ncbi:DUF4249 domain-containing protein [Pontibacter ramchanderi]|nr:DUF4249 domain-containing protein [Pontibacter ramchanderi]
MRRLLSWLVALTGIGMASCIDPIVIQTGETEPKLVVSGLITDQSDESLNKVSLSWSEPFDGESKVVYNRPVLGASVKILDNRGTGFQLIEGERGVYFLPQYMAGEAGQQYRLYIKLQDGREYESAPELLQPSPQMEQVSYTFKEFTEVVKNGSGELVEQTTDGFEVYATVQDPAGKSNYYRWDATGVFEYFSRAPDVIPIPATQCWSFVGRVTGRAVTANDRLFNGNIHKQTVVVLPADMPTKYLVRVRQYALTEQAHEFWRLFEQQQSSVGSIFDPPPAKIRGNLYSLSNPGEEVIGYFGASGISEKGLLINRAVHAPFRSGPYEPPFVAPPRDCRSLFPNSTAMKPAGF